ncbi:ROK family transcriptional regulator [Agromyces protaetiae]|uniref:ROK family transcriptional regulator n=1 Tax=Agromyces protaetiae TaxID=2509455 RepID=A0A4P6FFU9_9MICO|nr:ROK family transcriptional regulator [Agromyces protaetiae]QAY72667.1 ROK family transcriptional regulator [Agromyces protaetiae]
MRRGTNLPAVGTFNQTVVLDVIRRTPEGISRADLATATGLSSQTLSNVSRRLLDDGLIEEAGTYIQGRGKPPTLLRLIPTSRFAVGVHLDPAVVTYVLLDLGGEVVAHSRSVTPPPADPGAVVDGMAEAIDALLAESGVDRDAVLGIGIASPGPIDAERGLVLDPPLLEGWRDVPLRDALAAATGLPVLLEKDVNAAAVAELWVGDEQLRDFAFFYLGTGIGIGLVLDREVLRGSTGNAGEGGTLVVRREGLPRVRRSEQLGHLATPQYLVEQAVDEGVVQAQDASFDALLALARAHDEGALRVLHRAGGFIGSSLVSLVNLLDVDEIVFGGPYWRRIEPFVFDVIRAEVAGSPDRVTHHEVRLAPAAAGEDVAAIGAASLVLDATLSPRPSSLLISG